MTRAITPSEQDIVDIKAQLEEARRTAEYDKLKQDLSDITYKSANQPNEFDGMMQIPDTDKVLKTKRHGQQFFEVLFGRIRGMFSFRPVIGNIIALGIAMVAMFYIFHEVNMAGFEKYQSYFGIGIQIFAAIQIIKSGTRSLILPLLAMVVGSIAAHQLSGHQMLFNFSREFYQHLMIVGVIGLGISILSID